MFYYSRALYKIVFRFFVRKDSSIQQFETVNDLRGMIVCRAIGYNLFGLKEAKDQRIIDISSPASMLTCFKMLEKRRVDLVLHPEIVEQSINPEKLQEK